MGKPLFSWPTQLLARKASANEPELDLDSIADSSSISSIQPATPPGDSPRDLETTIETTTKMPTTSPITIATPSRNSSSSPSSHGQQKSNYHDSDTRTSAIMSATGFESNNGSRAGQNSYGGGAQPISMNNPNRNNEGRARRESLAGSLVAGMSWGGVSVGSWIRDE